MKFPKIRIGRAQRWAGLLLLVFLAQCSWVIGHQRLTAADYQYAECGREMWERPSPLAGYFTTCGNLHGDGTLAYRDAGLPLTMERLVLLGADKFRKPENRLYVGGTLNGSTWEARHQLGGVVWLMHLPFVLFAMWLGAGLWWVARRLFGNEGAFFALGLYCFSPAVVRYAVVPNNEVLAMWGLYGLVYTAIGVAHAMQGPRRKWKPRIVLLTLALGLTAAAHLVAAMVGFVAALILMMYLAERRRSYVMQILIFSALGALVLVFASFAFRAAAFTYVFTGGGGRFWFSLDGVKTFFGALAEAPIVGAIGVALVMWAGVKRSRYFGNTAPLILAALISLVQPSQVVAAAWLWAVPFGLTFTGGVFADAMETKHRKMFLGLAACLMVAQAVVCLGSLGVIARP
ncbi:hypothetical protein SAMN05421771_0836 [Granulicella pectinivorans]|uniref:Glycosyltransferase RgtA/B/C/D-like domain-containing protein n=1 Tax=Granulicella pectinivorans TaxID=474950 RepID=A0A1I6LKZ7_9BACT|nr:hypothetical protein [Granulicella pectinivorans]SFS03950.1 hypothetical protein SAMN05421771_0836 [Granulicella pectinivorans]